MHGNHRCTGGIRTALTLALTLGSQSLFADLWISGSPATGKPEATASAADKVLYIRRGAYDGALDPDAPSVPGEISALLIDANDEVQPARVDGNRIRFRAPLKGHHWVFLQEQRLDGETLEVSLTKYRFYNRQGDVNESLLKEIRGRTNDSKYGRPPVAEIPFEIVLQKPQQDHHISCCLYSGDRVRLKLFHAQQPLTEGAVAILSESGWKARFKGDDSGLVSFEIPRYRYSDSGDRRRHKQQLLITADYRVDSAGMFQGKPYRRIHYRMSLPVDFRPSPLEWAAKQPAFLLLAGVILALGFGVFLYRLKLRRRRFVGA